MSETHLHVHLHGLDPLVSALQAFSSQLDRIEILSKQGAKQMAVLDDKISALNAEVTRQKTIKDGVLAVVNGIPALIQDAVSKALAAGATPAQLAAFDQVSAALKANDDDLAAAVAANVPPTPNPTPGP
jgi:hypothetical protein